MKSRSTNLVLKSAILASCFGIAASLAGQAAPTESKPQPDRARQAQASRGPVSQGLQPAPPGDDYIIGAEDILSISVWKEPDLTRNVPVRPDGKISLPLIGEVVASGLTPPKLSSVITEKLKAYISNPEVNVIVAEVKSQVFNIIGQVMKPGPYELTRPTTMLDAIGLAGGPQPFAKLKRIYVMRQLPDGRQQKLYFDYKAALKGQKMDQNIYLKPGDVLIVP
jgi:polysaccharide biosynthesis/export protein